jgi:hypothetical protein
LPSSASRSASASATARIGSFTPVLECTHVSATILVLAFTARRSRVTISSTDAERGSS